MYFIANNTFIGNRIDQKSFFSRIIVFISEIPGHDDDTDVSRRLLAN